MEKTWNRLRHLLIVPLVAILVVLECFNTAVIKADTIIGSLNGKPYYDFDDLVDDLEDDYEGKDVVIDMLTDWIADSDSFFDPFDYRMVIPEDCNATLNMHGHIYNRDLVRDNDYDTNGELIYVSDGATLTINGSSDGNEKNTRHANVWVYSDIEQGDAPTKIVTYGGTLAGGNGLCGTGGIYINSGKDVYLNDVTIAGCKAYYSLPYQPFHSGYGGGIIITAKNTNLHLKDSLITGCLAQQDGGGIYATDVDNVSVYLDNSEIIYNYADSDGGGINLDGENLRIIGSNGASVSFNKTEGYGGGVYFWNDNVTINGVRLEANYAKNNGGGLYFMEEDSKVSNCTIINNSSEKLGGGIYINNDYTEIYNSTITNNSHFGVYIPEDCDLGVKITGNTVIENNTDRNGARGNLRIKDNTSFVNFSQSDGMKVYLGYDYRPADFYRINDEPCKDYSNHVFADDDNYEVAYSYYDIGFGSSEFIDGDTGGNRLIYVKKESMDHNPNIRVRQEPDIVTIPTQDIHGYTDGRLVYAGGYTEEDGVSSGTKYELRYLYPRHPSNGDKTFKMYYSDGFFFEDPYIYNNHLATASFSLASGGSYLGSYDDDYAFKHAGTRQMLSDIGCPDQMIYVDDYNIKVPGTDTIGVSIGSKTLQFYNEDTQKLEDTEYTLIIITTRGANYEDEWASNVTLGIGDVNNGEALGFSEAADLSLVALDYYIDRYGLRDKVQSGNVKFWVAGFSRGGATANLLSKRILENYIYETDTAEQRATGNQLFAYPCEAPKGGTDKAEQLEGKWKYFCIHNIINAGDLVPLVGPKEMGFKRYGVDHYIPGTFLGKLTRADYFDRVKTEIYTPEGASRESGVTKVTSYHDNDPLETKKDMDGNVTQSFAIYQDRRESVVDHLMTMNHTTLFYDYFHPWATKVKWPPMKLLGKYNGARLEKYLPNLVAFLQQEAFRNPDDPNDKDYRYKYVVEYDFQNIARAYFNATGDPDAKTKLDGIMSALDKIIHSDSVTWSMLLNVVGEYYEIDEEGHKYVIDYLWDKAVNYGAFDKMSAEEVKVVEKYWPKIANVLFQFTDGDFQLGNDGIGDPTFPVDDTSWVNGTYGSESGGEDTWLENKLIYSLTMFKNVDMIIDNNHSREVGIAWTRTYDSYYSDNVSTKGTIKENELSEYSGKWVTDKNEDNYQIKYPQAYISRNGNYIPLKEASHTSGDVYNQIEREEKIILEVGKIHEGVSPANQTQSDPQLDYDVLGEAIYYDIIDTVNNSVIANKTIYRGGIILPSDKTGGKFKVTAYGKSLGVESERATYYFNINIGHRVYIDDGSEIGKILKYYKDGEKVTVSANPEDGKFFTNWTVKLLDNEGSKIEDDIASIILNNHKKDAAVTFTMPDEGSEYESGKNYPSGYWLEISAQCHDLIRTVSADFDAPVPAIGDDPQIGLDNKAYVTFDNEEAQPAEYDILWTYTYHGKTYPASSVVYSGVEYTATVTIPKSIDNFISFIDSDRLNVLFEGDPYKVKQKYISRNDGDGSATFVIEFNATESGGPEPPDPEAVVNLKIIKFDLNLNQEITDGHTDIYTVPSGSKITINAPEVDNEMFNMWNLNGAEGITLDSGSSVDAKTITVNVAENISGDRSIMAGYIPIINRLDVIVDEPIASQIMQTQSRENTLAVKISSTYQIHPDFVDIIWSPQPKEGKADYLTNYTITVKLSPKKDEQGEDYIRAKTGNTDYIKIAAVFDYSDNPITEINGSTALLDKNSNSISYTFPMTTYTLEKIYPPEEITGIPYGASADQVKSALPKTVDILLDDGSTVVATVSWETPERSLDPDTYDSHVWLASGLVELPYGVDNKKEIPRTVVGKAVENAAESVARAIPSKDPGVYQDDIRVALSCETEGATIFWTTDPDATDEDDYRNWNEYNGTPIPINRADAREDELDPRGQPTGRKKISLRAVSYKEGMRPDGPRTYSYIFANEIKVPEGRNNYYNGEPQTGVDGYMCYVLEPISQGVTINKQGDAQAVEVGTYQVKAKINEGYRWEIVNPETGETTYTKDDQTIEFMIGEKPIVKYTITYDLNYEWKKITEEYDEGTVISIREAPIREGHTFVYWQGSIHYPGDPYKVTNNHTFTAVWKRNEPIPPYDPPRTGIE